MNVLECVLGLVESLDCDEGVNEMAHDNTLQLVSLVLGIKAFQHLSNCIDATEDRFYIKAGINIFDLKNDLVKIWMY